jgi:MYXO-CTERM domain-containing protein
MPTLRSLPAFALAALLATPAAATTISFQNGFGGYAGADNESYSFDGTLNQDQIRVDLPSASQPEGSYAWIVFTGLFGDGAVPSDATIVSATLEGLVRNPFGSATATRLLADIESRPYGAGASVLDGAGSFFDDTQLVSVAHPDCGDPVECVPPAPIAWDVTAIVQAWANGATNYGFLLLPETVNGGKLFATDDPDPALRPRLVITFAGGGVSVPEPGLLALLALALPLALRRRA